MTDKTKLCDFIGIFATCIFFSLVIIGMAGMMGCLDIAHFWHIFTTLVISNGLIFTIYMCDDAKVAKEEEDRRLGRRWVWDKPPYEACDPMDTAGHYEYDDNKQL